MPKIESKLTNLFAGVLSSVEVPVLISFIAHINPLEMNGEQTLFTLEFQDKVKQFLKSEESTENKKLGPFLEHLDSLQKLVKRATKEKENLKNQLEELELQEEEEFEEIKKKLGLEYTV